LLLVGRRTNSSKDITKKSSSYPIPSHTIIMQGPTEEAEASISQGPTEEAEAMEEVGDDPNLDTNAAGSFSLRRKAAKRTLPWELVVGDLNLVSSQSQPSLDEDIPATKKPRLEEPSSASTNEVATKISSHDTAVSLPAALTDHADAEPVKGTQATGRWTPEEDAKLESAIMSTRKKCGKLYRIDWVATAALVPDRTRTQCRDRWHRALNRSINRANDRTGKWSKYEDSKLKDAVQTHGGNNWGAIAALVPDRTRRQCRDRWLHALHLSVDPTTARRGKWTADEHIKLKDAVQMHNGNNWGAIAALVSDRTSNQCRDRWRHALNHSINRANDRTGKWSKDEDTKLKDAEQD
jgi:hypothetical protein